MAIHLPRNFMDSTFLFSGEDREISDLLPCAYVFTIDKTMQLTNTSPPQNFTFSTLSKLFILVYHTRFTCIYYNASFFFFIFNFSYAFGLVQKGFDRDSIHNSICGIYEQLLLFNLVYVMFKGFILNLIINLINILH